MNLTKFSQEYNKKSTNKIKITKKTVRIALQWLTGELTFMQAQIALNAVNKKRIYIRDMGTLLRIARALQKAYKQGKLKIIKKKSK